MALLDTWAVRYANYSGESEKYRIEILVFRGHLIHTVRTAGLVGEGVRPSDCG